MSDVYVFDACALIAFLNDEVGADSVAAVFEKAKRGEARLLMNMINLFEVYYGFYHEKGRDFAERTIDGVRRSAISICDFTNEVFTEAGRLKVTYKISLADSIVLAQAAVSGGVLLTADHHELDVVEGRENIRFQWIR